MADVTSGLQLFSTAKSDGTLELSVEEVTIPDLKPEDILVRVEASPINPSDLGLLFGFADPTTAKSVGTSNSPKVSMTIPDSMMKAMKPRLDQHLPAGNEGAGIVVAAGASDEAQALMGKTVALLGGAMYAQYRIAKPHDCLVLHDGTTPEEGASCFVNPLTALGMVETMKLEGHTALVHTAAASNLGQMLQKICNADGVDLVNIVRRQEHVDLLKGLGAKHVCNSSEDSFMEDLTAALKETNATIGFDATGGGKLAGQILTCMETAQSAKLTEFNRYGSTTHKQVYIYGGLDRTPTTLNRSYGMAWGIGGWLLPFFLQRIGFEASQKLRDRVADEIKTTFASSYVKTVSLAEALDTSEIGVYAKQATGEKYLVNPHKG